VGTNWWLKFLFVIALILLAVRALIPTFVYPKPTYMPRFKVQYKLDLKGNPVVKDGKKVVLYEKHETGKKKGQVVKDRNNQPIPLFARSEDGMCIPEFETEAKKKGGKATYKRDKNGRLIPKFVLTPVVDDEGKPKLDPKTKKPLMSKAFMTDAVWERCYLPWWYRKFFPYKKNLRLGLDLQGGTHLVLRVDVEKAINNKASRLADDLASFLSEKKLITSKNQIFHDPDKSEIEITLKGDATKARNAIEKNWDYLKTYSSSKAGVYIVRYSPEYIKKSQESAVSQAIDTIRGRVDALGVSEPSISKYGETEIVIQLPGLKDPKRAKELIGKTALLAFHVVEDDAPAASKIFDEMKKDPKKPKGVKDVITSYSRPNGAAPGTDRLFWGDNKKILTRWINQWNRKLGRSYGRKYKIFLGAYEISGRDKDDMPWRTYLLERKASLTGEGLDEARPQLDPEMNRPEVGLNFNRKGASTFEDMTGKHVGHRFAIVLEGRVDSAPVIQARIGGGRARITLGGLKSYEESMKDAKDLAFVLKSGSLPAPVDLLYEKTVGPGLGKDSIQRGMLSLLVGFILVILFILFFYKGAGFNANVALLLNILFVMGVMAGFGAVLTLPGMAGILLTIGMAVDANILIFERIREELRAGKAVRIAVQNGYEKAFSTILDANVTTAIAGIVLYQYGSGPIRGFAVTLLIGIVCSVFTALFVTRFIFDLFLSGKSTRTTLSI